MMRPSEGRTTSPAPTRTSEITDYRALRMVIGGDNPSTSQMGKPSTPSATPNESSDALQTTSQPTPARVGPHATPSRSDATRSTAQKAQAEGYKHASSCAGLYHKKTHTGEAASSRASKDTSGVAPQPEHKTGTSAESNKDLSVPQTRRIVVNGMVLTMQNAGLRRPALMPPKTVEGDFLRRLERAGVVTKAVPEARRTAAHTPVPHTAKPRGVHRGRSCLRGATPHPHHPTAHR